MIQSKQNQVTEPAYYQAIGVLKGFLKSDSPAQGKNPRFRLSYHGRDYPVLPSASRFEQYKKFDLGKERLFLVYPQPRTYKAYPLLKRDYGSNLSLALLNVKDGLHRLYKTDAWCREFLGKAPILFKRSNLQNEDGSDRFGIDDLLDPKVAVQTEELRKAAHYIFMTLKKMLNEQNTRPSPEAKEIGSMVLSLLNGALCNQLYHPGTDKPKRAKAFAANWRRSRTFARESDIGSFKKMFYSLSFVLVAYSEGDSCPVYPGDRELKDGEFFLSGDWSPWKDVVNEDGTYEDTLPYATFSSFLNRTSPRDFPKTPLQSCSVPKRLIIFQGGDGQRVEEDCCGRAIAKFDPYYNTFKLNEFERVDQMHKPLEAKELVALQKQSNQKKPNTKNERS